MLEIGLFHNGASSLPIVTAKLLTEIPEPIKQTHRDQRQIQIARGFQMIAGQYSQAAGVKRQRVMNPKLSAKISNRCLLSYLWRGLQL